MTRLQAFLFLVLATLAVVVFARLAWGLVAPPVAALVAAVPSLVQAVPAWAWWTAFGIAMSLKCTLAPFWTGRRCGKPACGRPQPSPSA